MPVSISPAEVSGTNTRFALAQKGLNKVKVLEPEFLFDLDSRTRKEFTAAKSFSSVSIQEASGLEELILI